MGGRQNNQPIMKTIATVALCAVGAQAQWSWTTGGIPIPGSPGLVLNPLSQAVVPENSPQWHLEALRGQGLQVSVNGAITPEQTPEWKAAAARNAVAPTVKREAEAEPGTDGGDTVEPPLPEELLLSDRTLSLPTTLQSRRVPPGA